MGIMHVEQRNSTLTPLLQIVGVGYARQLFSEGCQRGSKQPKGWRSRAVVFQRSVLDMRAAELLALVEGWVARVVSPCLSHRLAYMRPGRPSDLVGRPYLLAKPKAFFWHLSLGAW